MTDSQIQAVNIPATIHDPSGLITSEVGMNLIDLGFLQLMMTKLLPPEQAGAANRVLANIAASMQMLQKLAAVTAAGMTEAIAQRDAALREIEALTDTGVDMLVIQRDAALAEFQRLNEAIAQIDQTDPQIAALVRTVWDAAQADLLNQLDSRKGA